MRKINLRIVVAFAFLLLGSVKIIDWFIFWSQNKMLALENRELFLTKYIERFPGFLQPLFRENFLPSTILFIVLFSIAGLLFLKEKKRGFTILGILSFILGFWNLFSIM